MADIATQDNTEFDSLHPNLKQLYTGGFDLNPKTVNMLNEGNAFKFDLWNTSPQEIDPEIIPRKEQHAQSVTNALGYGFMGSASSFMELLGSVPGGMDRFYDWSRTVLGKEPTEDSVFDYAENYLKSIAKSTDPEEMGFTAPEGYLYKTLAGFAAAPIAVASYIPAIRGIKALGTLGKVGQFAAKRSLPLGLAVTDVAREIDEGSAFELGKAAAYGYGTGKVLQFANKLGITPRMATLGGFGFLTAGHNANIDDRFAAATVWGALGYLGPKAGGLKVDLVQEAQSSKNYKRVMGDRIEFKVGQTVKINKKGDTAEIIKEGIDGDQMAPINNTGQKFYIFKKDGVDIRLNEESLREHNFPEELPDIQKVTEVRGEAANEFLELNIRYIENSQRLKEAKEAQKIVEENNKLVQEGKEPTEIPEALKEKGLSETDLQKLEKQVNDDAAHITAQGKVLMTGEQYNEAVRDMNDPRKISQFLVDQYGPNGRLKNPDMESGFLDKAMEGTLNLATAILPPKFINNPVFRYMNEKFHSQFIEDNTTINTILFDPKVILNRKFLPGRKEGEDFTSYRVRLQDSGDMLKVFGHASVKDINSGLTEFQILSAKEPKQAADIIDANARIWLKKKREAAANKEEYNSRKTYTTIFDNVDFYRLRKEGETIDQYGNTVDIRMLPNGVKGTFNDFMYFKMRDLENIQGKVENEFKYEATEKDLKAEGLNDTQVRIYLKLRDADRAAVRIYNESVLKNVKEGEGRIVEESPNHLPRIFSGGFRVWALKYNPETGKYSSNEATAIGAGNKLQADATRNWLIENYGKETYTTKTGKVVPLYKFPDPVIKSKDIAGAVEADAFMELFKSPNIKGQPELLEKLEGFMMENRVEKGFGKFTLKRQDVDGYLGSRLAAQNYWFSQTQKKFIGGEGKSALEKNINTKMAKDFESAMTLYISGAVRAASRHKTNKWLNDFENKKIVVPREDGTLRVTTIKKDSPNAVKYGDIQKRNIYGELQDGKISQAVSQIGRKWLGESGMANTFGTMNKITLVNKLLFGQMRYLTASAIQPYHMIFPKLLDMKYSGMSKGKVTTSMLRSLYDLILPSKEIAEAHEYAMRVGVIEAKFMNEAMTRVEGMFGRKELDKPFLGKKVFDFEKLWKGITFQNLAAKVEQTSRLNAFTMFYNFARSAGKDKIQAQQQAAKLADMYMVEYTYLEQPGIYGAKGLGTAGKPFGLFKTFQHNYLAQLVEYATKAKQGKGSEGLVGFLGQMVFAAGLFGTIGMKTADDLLNKLSPVIQKLTGEPLPSITETVMTSNYPEFVKYGIPSSMLGIDLTATLAAPGVSVTDLISVPSLNYWGLTPRQIVKGRGIIPTGFNALTKALTSDSPFEKRDAWVMFLQDSVPTSMHAIVEKYYMGIPQPYAYWKEWDLTTENKDAYKYTQYGPVRDVFKKGRGELFRTAADWRARTLSSYSLRERELLKLVYTTTKIKSDLQVNTDSLISAGAQHLGKEGYVPLWIYNQLQGYGLTSEQIDTKITNRVGLMDSDFISRLSKRTKSLEGNTRIDKIVNDILKRKYTYYGAY
mgnify:FL=1